MLLCMITCQAFIKFVSLLSFIPSGSVTLSSFLNTTTLSLIALNVLIQTFHSTTFLPLFLIQNMCNLYIFVQFFLFILFFVTLHIFPNVSIFPPPSLSQILKSSFEHLRSKMQKSWSHIIPFYYTLPLLTTTEIPRPNMELTWSFTQTPWSPSDITSSHTYRF